MTIISDCSYCWRALSSELILVAFIVRHSYDHEILHAAIFWIYVLRYFMWLQVFVSLWINVFFCEWITFVVVVTEKQTNLKTGALVMVSVVFRPYITGSPQPTHPWWSGSVHNKDQGATVPLHRMSCDNLLSRMWSFGVSCLSTHERDYILHTQLISTGELEEMALVMLAVE